MKTTSFSDFRTNLKTHLDSASQDHEPLLVTRQQGEAVVVMSLAEYNSHQTTVSLLSTPEKAIKLMKSIEEYKRGEYMTVDMTSLNQFLDKPE